MGRADSLSEDAHLNKPPSGRPDNAILEMKDLGEKVFYGGEALFTGRRDAGAGRSGEFKRRRYSVV